MTKSPLFPLTEEGRGVGREEGIASSQQDLSTAERQSYEQSSELERDVDNAEDEGSEANSVADVDEQNADSFGEVCLWFRRFRPICSSAIVSLHVVQSRLVAKLPRRPSC